jgi:DNA-binding response OmpR family regulator
MIPASILIVDHDPNLRSSLTTALKRHGFTVMATGDGAEAVRLTELKNPKVILLDLEMHHPDAADICKALTADPHFHGRVVVTSKHNSVRDHVSLLAAGASDFMTKPLEPRVLIAKINAIVRDLDRLHFHKQESHILRKGDFKLDEITRNLWFKGSKICSLTETQFKMVKWFLEKTPGCISRKELFEQLFEHKSYDMKLVDIHLHHLRQRLGKAKSRLKNVYGKGYLLVTAS